MIRAAQVTVRADSLDEARKRVGAALPDNYNVVDGWRHTNDAYRVIVKGADRLGWTLDGYVLPRLGSALYCGEEISVSDALILGEYRKHEPELGL